MSQNVETHAYSIGTLDLTASPSSTLEDVAEGQFDLGLFFPSWDGRCTCITHSEQLYADVAVEVAYENKGTSGEFGRNRATVAKWLENQSERVETIVANPNDMRGCCGAIQKLLTQLTNEKRRPIRVFVDLSAASRMYALATVAYGISSGLVREFTFFYSEGQYRKADASQSEKELFSWGRWEAITVPGMEGDFRTGHSFALVVSLGFEGAKTLRILNKVEPSRVAALLPVPGFSKDYEEMTRARNALLIENHIESDSDLLYAEAGNVVAACKALEGRGFDTPAQENVIYLCCGTKPHSLAMGVRALALGYPTVLYNKPDKHMENHTMPTGRYWRYTLRDRSTLEA